MIIDGDTIHLENSDSVRFIMVNSPEIITIQGKKIKSFLESICPVGSTVSIDEDDRQLQKSYGGIIGVVY